VPTAAAPSLKLDMTLAAAPPAFLDAADLLGTGEDSAWLREARPQQLPPDGDWFVRLIMAGRGWGKTRAAWLARGGRATEQAARSEHSRRFAASSLGYHR
jgi:hypothetical protein